MKKLIAMLLMLALMCCGAALAEDLGVQVIGGEENAPLMLDDIQLGLTYQLEGYARVKPVEFCFVDYFAQFNKDADRNAVDDYNKDNSKVYYEDKALKGDWAYAYKQASWKDSGSTADFLWLKIDVVNRQKVAVPFMDEMTVKVVYDDEYEFGGWIRQINYDYNTICYRYGSSTVGGSTVVLDRDNQESIGMMYTGTYIIGCTIPNMVVEDKTSPLRIEFTIGENEMTYHVRK